MSGAAPPPTLAALFEREGAPLAGGARAAFVLRDAFAWRVAAGWTDVFATRSGPGGEPGARRHLFRAEAGDLLLAVDAEGAAASLLAVPGPDALLHRLPAARLRAPDGPPEGAVRAALAGWTQRLCDGLAGELLPERLRDAGPAGGDTSVELEAGGRLRAGPDPVCLRVRAGEPRLFGRATLPLPADVPLPLAGCAWVEAVEPASLELRPFDALPAPEAWAGVERLHALALASSAADAAEEAEEVRRRARARADASRASLASACAGLAAAMDTAGDAAAMRMQPRDAGEDALFAACRLVAEASGIETRAAPPDGGDPLERIARASRVRMRRVLLADGWWRDDAGPMLGFAGEERRPVALLPHRRAGYLVCDPVRRTRRPAAEEAESLAPFGRVFYRPLPAAPLRPAGLLRFALRGAGRDLRGVAGAGAAVGVLGLATPVAVGVLYNSAIPEAERAQLLQLTLLLLVAAVAVAALQLSRGIALIRVEGRAGAALQAAVWDRLLALPLHFFRGRPAGDVAVRAMGIETIRQLLSGSAVTALVAGAFATLHLALLVHYAPGLALPALLLIGAALAATLGAGWAQLRHQRRISTLQAELSGTLLQFLTGISKLRVAGAEARAFAIWARRFGEIRRLRYRVRRIGSGLASFHAAFPFAASAIVFAGAAAALDDGLRTGDFLAFVASFAALTAALLAVTRALESVLAAIPHYENVRPILEAAPETDETRRDPGPLAGEIQMDHVSFRYAPDLPPILDDFSLHVRPGEFVALVGPSGAGKSTVLRLLLGFETPEAGSIHFDGQEVGGLDWLAVRRQIGVVLQGGRLMQGDVFSNIVGSAEATLDDAWEAARMAGLADDIEAMPMKMHTIVTEGGGTLSGGQRQRLMIARAVVTRPRILFFDEATSALDNRTQAAVSESLARLSATRVVVAHRLSTIRDADRILVVEGGRVVQEGRYDELADVPGPFAELARRQRL